jgi:O-antigen ligase
VKELAQVGGVVACAGLAALLVTPWRLGRLAGLAAMTVGFAGMAQYLLPDVSSRLLVAGAAGAAVGGLAGAWLLLRWPYLLAFATLGCVPARLPVDIGSEEVNLLVPLYAVVAALGLSLAWRLAHGEARMRELGPAAWPLAAFVLWTGLSLLWTVDARKGAIFVAAFVVPFGLLAVGFARLPWRGRWLAWLWGGLVATALVYAVVGLYQWSTREVFWNPSVIVFNAYAPFFRVNSVFWDPSVYGRYLAVAVLATLAGILLGGVRGWRVAGLYLVVAATWLGLLLSFSQSSFAALAAGIVVAAAVAWGKRAVVALVALGIVAAAVTFAVPQIREEIVDRSRTGFDKVTGGRSGLVGQGVRIALDRPLHGVGVGGFSREYARRTGIEGKDPKRTASHTTPVTVAAEGGAVGFVWLLATMLVVTLLRLGRGFTSRVSLAVGIVLFAIAVHSLFYNAFFEDPMMWALTGLIGLVSRVPRKPPPPAPAGVPAAEMSQSDDYAHAVVEGSS